MRFAPKKREWLVLGSCLWSPALSIAQPQATQVAVSREAREPSPNPLHERLGKVRRLSDRIASLRGSFARVSGLAAVGQAACKYDPQFSREVFLKAFEILLGAEDGQARLRAALIPRVAQCDSDLAFELNRKRAPTVENPEGKAYDAGADIDSAFDLLKEQPQRAAAFAERVVLGGPLSEEQRQSLLVLLLRLRQIDAPRADAQFLGILHSLQAHPRIPTMELMHWGNYVFTARFLLEKGIQDGVAFTRVGTVSVYDLGADRPGIPEPLTRQYLAVALDVLSRPVIDPAQRQIDYFALYQFLEKSDRYSPELAPSFALLRKRLEEGLPATITSVSPESALGRSFEEPLGDYLADLERTSDSGRRQTLYFRLATSLWHKKDFAGARKHARSLEDSKVRAGLLELIDWAEIEETVESGKMDAATEIGGRLSPGLLRSLSLARIAAGWQKQGDSQRALSSLYLARKDAPRVSEQARPYLLLVLCATAARMMDRPQAEDLLEQTVRAFNQVKPKEKAAKPALITEVRGDEDGFAANVWGFTRWIEFSGVPRNFNLRVKDLARLEFSPDVIGLFCEDPGKAENILGELREEEHRASAWGSLANCYIDGKKKGPRP